MWLFVLFQKRCSDMFRPPGGSAEADTARLMHSSEVRTSKWNEGALIGYPITGHAVADWLLPFCKIFIKTKSQRNVRRKKIEMLWGFFSMKRENLSSLYKATQMSLVAHWILDLFIYFCGI